MFDVEILRLAQTLGYKVKEVGIRWQDDGDSRLELVAGNWRNAKDILKIGLRRFKAPAPSNWEAASEGSGSGARAGAGTQSCELGGDNPGNY